MEEMSPVVIWPDVEAKVYRRVRQMLTGKCGGILLKNKTTADIRIANSALILGSVRS
jgi:hypothetical protein